MLADVAPQTATTEIPPWLETMRTITGVTETPGAADNDKILAMAKEIGRLFPEMASYCAGYVHDSIPWCGLTAGYVMAMAGIRPPFKKGVDTDCFFWALSWASDADFIEIKEPRPGCVVVLTRSGGGHVSLYERTDGRNYVLRGGNQGDAINERPFPISSVVKLVWPRTVPLPTVPPAARREIKTGDTGPDVEKCQFSLGLPIDGDFGDITHAGVCGFQAAAGLAADGIVGSSTWTALDALDARKLGSGPALDNEQIVEITKIAENSAAVSVDWGNRGRAPVGYTVGMALCFALAQKHLALNAPGAVFASQADSNKPDTDALSWYAAEFKAAGMSNAWPGLEVMRHLFVLMTGLGMRESSGLYYTGVDTSAGASSQTSDTAEAGLMQTSWNIRSASPYIAPLLPRFWENPNGFLSTFKRNITPKANDLKNIGSGDGAKYQFLSKYAPAFTIMVTGLGLRVLRKHWGPINRKEAILSREVDAMLKAVQDYMQAEPPLPEPEPGPEVAEVRITTKGKVTVIVNEVVITA